jgi:hypothetical protein
MRTTSYFLVPSAALVGAVAFCGVAAAGDAPDLTGTWRGYSVQITNQQGYRAQENTITITDQNGRRFRGEVKHAGGTENFIGVIRSNNRKFYWVDVEDEGHVVGEIIRPNVIETCYLDAGEDAVAGCTLLTRQR